MAVGVVAAAAGYVLTRFNYSSIPPLPRLAGATAALIGLGEAIAGYGLRSRIRDGARGDRDHRAPQRPPVPPLTAARALQVAKASALAGVALMGLWLGFGLYVVPTSMQGVAAAAGDSVTAVVGLVCAGVLLAGALYLENCCRTPEDGPPDASGRA